MTAFEIIKFAEAAGIELWVEGERLRYRSPQQPDLELLSLVIQHKSEIVKLLERDTMLPRLPWQLERLVEAACSGALVVNVHGVPDTARYVMAWAATYMVSSQRDEPLRRLWEVYQAWQTTKN
jgi:TubC N-terminal docking domain